MLIYAGNVKELAKKDPHVTFASFEAHRNETAVIIVVSSDESLSKTQIEDQTKLAFEKFGVVKSVNYYKDGADVITAHRSETFPVVIN